MSIFFIFLVYLIPAIFSLVLWFKILIILKVSTMSIKWLNFFIWSFIPIVNLFCVCYALDYFNFIQKESFSKNEFFEESSDEK
jgi:hypothetical protein